MSIRQRLDKNKSFYHIKELSYESHAYDLRNYINNKYNIDVEALVEDLFKKPVSGAVEVSLPNQQIAPSL